MFEEYLEKFSFKEGEKAYHVWMADLFDGKKTFIGYLVLTDKRLLFFKEEGDFVKEYFLVFDLDLKKISKIEETKYKWVDALMINGSYFYNLKDTDTSLSPSPKKIISIVEHFRGAGKIGEVPKTDFITFLEDLEKVGLKVESIVCTNCGSYILPPKSGSIKCFYCDTIVTVQEIEERLRKLVGSK